MWEGPHCNCPLHLHFKDKIVPFTRWIMFNWRCLQEIWGYRISFCSNQILAPSQFSLSQFALPIAWSRNFGFLCYWNLNQFALQLTDIKNLLKQNYILFLLYFSIHQLQTKHISFLRDLTESFKKQPKHQHSKIFSMSSLDGQTFSQMIQNHTRNVINHKALKGRINHPFSALSSLFCKFNILESLACDNSFLVTNLVSGCFCQQVIESID